MKVWGKRFKLPQLTHESFLTIYHSCKIFFWYLPNWTSTDLWCVVLYVTYSTTRQRSVEVQFGRYQKNILQEWSMIKKLSCVSHGSLKRFPHTFTTVIQANWRLSFEDDLRSGGLLCCVSQWTLSLLTVQCSHSQQVELDLSYATSCKKVYHRYKANL